MVEVKMEVGEILDGVICGIKPFGVFVKFKNGKSGLAHISKCADKFIANLEDEFTMWENVKAEVLEIDDKGKINLKIISTITTDEAETEQAPITPRARDLNRKENSRPFSKPKFVPSTPEERFEAKMREFASAGEEINRDLNRRSKRRQK